MSPNFPISSICAATSRNHCPRPYQVVVPPSLAIAPPLATPRGELRTRLGAVEQAGRNELPLLYFLYPAPHGTNSNSNL